MRSLAAWWVWRNSDDLVDGERLVRLAVDVEGDHRSGWMTADLGGGEPLQQVVLAVLVHQEADRAAVHAVDRLAVVHDAWSVCSMKPSPPRAPAGPAPPRPRRAPHRPAERAARAPASLAPPGRPSRGGGARGMLRGGAGGETKQARPSAGKRQARSRLSTFRSAEAAEGVGRALVEGKLAACVNIVPGMVSVYRWEGRIERGAGS